MSLCRKSGRDFKSELTSSSNAENPQACTNAGQKYYQSQFFLRPKRTRRTEYLASGVQLSMRLWEKENPAEDKPETVRDYETIGFVIEGKAGLYIEGQRILLDPGDSWVVPKGAKHRYKILEPFTAVEVTSPPAEFHARDD